MEKLRQFKWFPVMLVAVLILLTLASRISIAYYLANDDPGDGRVYAQFAKNLLEQNVFSLDAESPFKPTLIRLPGYPLFMAAIYAVFGHGNDTAVRLVQAVFDTGTCVIIALLAWLWTDDEERRRKNALWTFILISLCPFMVIYTATLLTETMTTFLMAAMTLTATLAFKSSTLKKSLAWWFLTGILAGMDVLLRPDSGLFAAGIGLTLTISGLFFCGAGAPKFIKRFFDTVWKGAIFSLAFSLILAPWTIRNYVIFGLFQPLAPAHAEMPGEFVPHGYERWLRTWVDDSRFIEPTLWNLNEKRLSINKIPARTFDSDEERERVAALLAQYNHPPGSPDENTSTKSGEEENSDSDDTGSDDSASADDDKSDDNQADEADESGDDNQPDDEDNETPHVVKMTPEIDAGFEAIAEERIARAPARYYFWLPCKRAAALWFDSHSLYYPFGGQMSPVTDLDYDENQQVWLPVFTAVMWLYTLLALGGVIQMWRDRKNVDLRRWLLLLGLMTLPRIAFLSSIENPEPRYVVELFAFTALLGGFVLGRLRFKKDAPPADEDRAATEIPVGQPPPPSRLLSLDVFRGITIAGMVLVNAPGTWEAIYPPLEHAAWNGATPTDLIFPFFLFIVGISITFSLGKIVDARQVNLGTYLKTFKRALIMFAIGLFLNVFPLYNIWKAEWFEPAGVRIMGVLQRIAVCYLVCSLIFLWRIGWKKQLVIAVALLLFYWALMTLINVPACELTSVNDRVCNLSAYLDRSILTENHIWNQSKVFDPEGLLSTLPAIATTLAGVLTGHWLKSKKTELEKVHGIFFSGAGLIAVGYIWSFWFPLNKSLWTSSYAVYTVGMALCLLGFCYWLVDIKGYREWACVFVVFGTNAIALYIGSSILGAILSVVEVPAPHDQTVTLQEWIFKTVFSPLAMPVDASLLYAFANLLLWLFLMWLLYRKRIFIKI